jgi:hypothetical protein
MSDENNQGIPNETRTCIYCLEKKAEDQFNREHVIPEAFGKFENNLVLDCVCTKCNQHFGDTVDLKLARDSIEGIDRFWSGLKPTSEFKSLGRRSTTVAEFREGPNAGIRGYLHPNPTNAELRMQPLPHIGFAQDGVDEGRICWFASDKVPSKSELETFGFVKGRELMVHVREMSWEDARSLLGPKGYEPLSDPEVTMPPEGETLAMETLVIIGRLEQRAVAKIALNYLAVVGGSALARAPQFDGVRNFVRYDVGTSPVQPTENVLGFAMNGKPVEKGHYLAVQTTRERRVVADVCLMLRLRYFVLLSDVPFTVATPRLYHAHLFDVRAREVSPATPPPPLFGQSLKPYRAAAATAAT